MKYYKLLLIALLLISCSNSNKSNANENYQVIAENLVVPWEILWGPDGWIWLTERPGTVRRVNPDTREMIKLIEIDDVHHSGEGGLLGMALHPNFTTEPYVYLFYTYRSGNTTLNKLVRYRYENDNLINPETLLDNIPGSGIHNGSRLKIDPSDNTLFITTGDASVTANSQIVSHLSGKILRMNLDGSIPADNPNPDSYVWAWGLRNSQGLVFGNGRLYLSEHGPATDDEINIMLKGRNYGWPNVAGYCETPQEKAFCEQNNVVEPISAWTPTIATCGLEYYGNDLLISELQNALLLTSLKDRTLWVLHLNPTGDEIIDKQEMFRGQFGRLRDVCVSPEGRIFIATSNRDGRANPAPNDDRIIEITSVFVSVNDSKNDKGNFILSPNPTQNHFRVITTDGENNITQLKIFDSLGYEISEINANLHNKNIVKTDILSSGTFFVKASAYINNKLVTEVIPLIISR